MTGRAANRILTDDPAATAYVTDTGLVCRPGNTVTLDGERVPVQAEWWFPAPCDEKAIARAVSLCRRCPGQDRCLRLALRVGEVYGVWGGHLFERPSEPGRPRRNPATPLFDQQGRRVS